MSTHLADRENFFQSSYHLNISVWKLRKHFVCNGSKWAREEDGVCFEDRRPSPQLIRLTHSSVRPVSPLSCHAGQLYLYHSNALLNVQRKCLRMSPVPAGGYIWLSMKRTCQFLMTRRPCTRDSKSCAYLERNQLGYRVKSTYLQNTYHTIYMGQFELLVIQ